MIRFIFVNQKGFKHWVLSLIVTFFTKGKYGHVAVNVNDKYIIEAIEGGVRKADVHKFDKEEDKQVISFPLTLEQLHACHAVTDKILGQGYDLDDCVIGGIHDLFGDDVYELAEALDNPKTKDCSAVATMYARVIFPFLFLGEEVCAITPEVLRTALLTEQFLTSRQF